ncbi:transcriptional regulator, ArsR family [Lachnoclostridium phytofermentans ISDg]|uniref:Transcriptional regulator, ArsR family n=2 Tax=Lachnoclostridium phytofermentans TaxID=66219 RepID=A9KMX8_LACP7|nr:transcriptional regulator, ArsR family [Lachnoclostridium phytofermentans ISDg]
MERHGYYMTESDAIKLFKSLADKSRLMILKSLAEQPMYVELLANRLNLTPPTISFHLKKLEEAGVVNSKKEQYYTIYSLKESILNAKILDIIKEESSEKEVQEEREEQYREKVIESFFEYGKLKSIPVQRKKKRIILEEIAKAFELDRIYTEREVNITIADYHDDFCTLRRDMISEKILTRDEKGYQLIKKD